MRRSTRASSTSLAGLAAVCVVVAACGSGGATGTATAPPEGVGPSTPTVSASPQQAPVRSDWNPTEEALAQGLPRSTRFANVEFRLTGARLGWQTPASYGSSTPEPTDVPHVFLDLTAHNTSTGVDVRIPDDTFQLLAADAADAAVFEVVHGGFATLEADSTTSGFLAFAVPESFELATATLRIGRRPDTPALLPLSGGLPPSVYPIGIDVNATATGPGQLWGNPVRFEVLGAVLSKDLAVERCCPETGPRANEDELFLTVDLRITGPDDIWGDQVGDRSVRLLVDGILREPWYAPLTASKGSAVDLQAAFVLPAETREIVLRLGDAAEGTPGQVKLVLPDPATAAEAPIQTMTGTARSHPEGSVPATVRAVARRQSGM